MHLWILFLLEQRKKALARMAPFEIKGFYAGWNGTEDERNVDVKAMFKEKTASFLQRFKIMETFITSLEPSVNYFDDNGNPVFSYQDRSERELKYVSCIARRHVVVFPSRCF